MNSPVDEKIDELVAAADVAAEGPERAEVVARLASLGAERLHADPGSRFDPNIHRAVAVVPAQTPAQENLIAATVRPGWRHGGRMLRYVEVRVHVPPTRRPETGAS